MKYYNYQITTSEIPGEITLCINISNCPIHCPGCHSKFLWENIGVELTKEELYRIIDENKGVSCVCLMGGDRDIPTIKELIKSIREQYKDLKIAWYSGQDMMYPDVMFELDYYKYGSYMEELGGLDSKTTNQRLYKMDEETGAVEDITYKFWR